MALTVMVGLVLILVSVAVMPEPKEVRAHSYTLRTPIVINGNSGFTAANGVVSGSGSAGDPYIISGWEIRVQTGNGISITGTTAYFIISDVHVNSTASASGVQHAIYLYSVAHGQVKTSLLNNTPTGIHIELASNSSIHHNTIRGNSLTAVELFTVDHVNVVGNSILSANGVTGTTWMNSVVELNRIENSNVAIQLTSTHDMVVQQNTLIGDQFGVMVTAGARLVITGNNATFGDYGIYIWDCSDFNVSGNDISRGNASGLFTSEPSVDITFMYNRVRNSMYAGYYVEGANSIVVRENLFQNNTFAFAHVGGGVTITSALNMTFFYNNFLTNTPAQVEDPTGAINRWNGTYPVGGNYWTDYTGWDNNNGPNQNIPGSDGYGDFPYVIDSDTYSFYPLMTPYYINSKPDAMFTVTPPSGSTGTNMRFDAGSSSDPDEGVGDSVQEYRWDFDGDGNWDSSWSSNDRVNYVYAAPGNYTVILEVSDSHGLTSLYSVQVTITGTVIPEFGSLALPAIALMAMAVLASVRFRRTRG